MKIFISPSGNDEGEGTENTPLTSIGKALERLISTQGGVLVLKPGTYRFENTLILTKPHSGTENSPLTIKAETLGSVIITGGIAIDRTQCEPLSNDVYFRIKPELRHKIQMIDLDRLGIAGGGAIGPRGFSRPYRSSPIEIFIEGVPLTLSQFPKEPAAGIKISKVLDTGSIPRNGDFSNRGATFKFLSKDIQKWESDRDIWITGLFNYGYADDTLKVKDLDTRSGILSTDGPHIYGFSHKHPWNCFYFLNIPESLTEPGEYVIDYKNNRLLFIPPLPLADDSTIQLSILEDPLIFLDKTENLSFENIIFENSRGMGVYLQGGHHNIFKNCIFRNLGMVAANLGLGITPDHGLNHELIGEPAEGIIGSLYAHLYQDTIFNRKAGHHNGLLGCEIYNTGAGGVVLGGGNRITLEAGLNFVDGCHIHHFNRWDRSYKTAVNIDGVGNIIRNCRIHDAPGTAILLHGNNHKIEFNEVYETMLEGDDQGVFYYGRDPSEFGNIICYNYFHDNGISEKSHNTTVIYLDDGACGLEVYGNVFNRGGKSSTFLIGGGSYNKIHHNIIMNSRLAFHIDNRNNNWAKSNLSAGSIFHSRLDAVNFQSPPYSSSYPELTRYWEDRPAIPMNKVHTNYLYHVRKKRTRKKKWGQFTKLKRLKISPVQKKGRYMYLWLPQGIINKSKIIVELLRWFNSKNFF